MNGKKQSPMAKFFVTAFIGFIVISFMFTGYESFNAPQNVAATVGGHSVSLTEFNNEKNRQLQFYKNFFGGKDLTNKQMERFRINENTIRNLVQQKVMLIFSEKAGVVPSPAQIKEEIKKLPYFQTNGQFDINRYKQILLSNGLTPAKIEEDMANNIKRQLAQMMMANFPISNKYMEEVNSFKSIAFNSNIAQISKEAFRKHIKVSNTKAKKYLATKTNMPIIEALYNERKVALDKKAKGGLKSHQMELAKELLRKDDNDGLKKVIDSVASKIKKALDSNKIKTVESLQKKYGFAFEKSTNINRLEGATGNLLIDSKDLATIFKKGTNAGSGYIFNTVGDVTIVKVSKLAKKNAKETEKTLETERASLTNVLSKKLAQNVIQSLEENVKVKINNRVLQ